MRVLTLGDSLPRNQRKQEPDRNDRNQLGTLQRGPQTIGHEKRHFLWRIVHASRPLGPHPQRAEQIRLGITHKLRLAKTLFIVDRRFDDRFPIDIPAAGDSKQGQRQHERQRHHPQDILIDHSLIYNCNTSLNYAPG